jgi:hypothetical protein
MSPAPRVVIADEHPTMRVSTRRLLERDGFRCRLRERPRRTAQR